MYVKGVKLTMVMVRYIFDKVTKQSWSMKSRLSATARIIDNRSFENDVVTMLQVKLNELNE